MAFTIEIVKWTWPDKVKNKAVYRDDEFVVSSTKKEAIEAIDFLLNKPQGLTYTITVYRDKKYFTYYRHSMPCLGGLVKYRDSHGDNHFMNPYFPRDIRVAFPEGKIIFIGCHRPNINKDLEKPYYQFILSPESPWVTAFGKKESIIIKDNYFILTNMKTDPTVFYSLMRLGGLAYGYGSARPNWNPKADILITKSIHAADPRRLAGQKPFRISGGTWAEGFGYTRPYNESIFKTSLPHKLKDFGGLAGYPQAPYENSYFVNTMREKFGLDVKAPINNTDKKAEDTLVKAWDFFKQESKVLDE